MQGRHINVRMRVLRGKTYYFTETMCKHPEFLNKGVTLNLSFWKVFLSATKRMNDPELGKNWR